MGNDDHVATAAGLTTEHTAPTEGSTLNPSKVAKSTEAVHNETSLQVTVLGDVEAYYSIPQSRVVQVPSDLLPVETLVLCPFFTPRWPADSCPMGAACRLVHADIAGLKSTEVHINYAWRSMEEVDYPRHAAGETLHVAAPNSPTPTDTMDSSCLLVTKALSSKRRPLTHCAHYYFNRQCNLGGECRFVHAVFVDANAVYRRRAPAPVQLGRGVGPTATCRDDTNNRASTPDSEHVGDAAATSDSPSALGNAAGRADDDLAQHHGALTKDLSATLTSTHSAENTPTKRGRRHAPYAVEMP